MGLQTRTYLKDTNRDFDNILDSMVTSADHFVTTGTVPTLTTTTAGDGTCTISATSTDTAGALTFADTWANSDTQLVTFNTAYSSAPLVFLANNGTDTDTGIAAIKYDAVAVTTTGFTITASGTCSGVLNYFVIQTV